MTGSIPRLLGYVTVGAGVAAASYVGLVTGACPLDLGIGRRAGLSAQGRRDARPAGAGLRRHRRAVPGPDPAGAGRQAAGAGSRQRHGAGGPLHPPRGRLGLVAQTVETVRFTRPEQVDFRLARGPIPHVVEAFLLTEQPAGGTLLAYRGGSGGAL